MHKPPEDFYQMASGNREAKCRKCRIARSKVLNQLNPIPARAKVRRFEKKHPEIKKLYDRQRQLRYPEKVRAIAANRRARKLSAAPHWANEFFINEAYDLAKRREAATGFKWHVDHIVPLKSDIVCGLHAYTNIQVIPAFINLKKSNLHWPGKP